MCTWWFSCCSRGSRRTASRHGRGAAFLLAAAGSGPGTGSGGQFRTRCHHVANGWAGFAADRDERARSRHRGMFRMQEMPFSFPRGVAPADAPAAVLRRQPGEPGRVPDRADRLRVQDLHRGPFQDGPGAEEALRDRGAPGQAPESETVGASPTVGVSTQPRDGGRGESDNTARGQGCAGGWAGDGPRRRRHQFEQLLSAPRRETPFPRTDRRTAAAADQCRTLGPFGTYTEWWCCRQGQVDLARARSEHEKKATYYLCS